MFPYMDSMKASKALVALSVRIAAWAPTRRPRNHNVLAENTLVPWPLIQELRQELDRLGYGPEWRKDVAGSTRKGSPDKGTIGSNSGGPAATKEDS